jgi:hypothetical protein
MSEMAVLDSYAFPLTRCQSRDSLSSAVEVRSSAFFAPMMNLRSMYETNKQARKTHTKIPRSPREGIWMSYLMLKKIAMSSMVTIPSPLASSLS